ncbi:riboflavin synthase [Parapedobacter sp. ISTM3]|uniref:Riboflavin synthase n=1 Tax=Parapedobacter luteus TaxID=623280 RepID=A0A1T5FEY8_9SPHI|nr:MULTISPECIES: riboflavin synthase [Parapedobacter]MBK1441457.1 riboflavin synthase [Parapedobacter sp. ISTM3]SKB94740.1 riboflavin synthase alpha chain [Parapedobacter luteus]
MFTGIIETIGTVTHLRQEAGNLHITVASSLSDELKIDQSVSHNGVCLTVVGLSPGEHTVTAIAETLSKSNLGTLRVGSLVNLERCTRVGDRLDGHIVQGHVDQTAQCLAVEEQQGSWRYTFRYNDASGNITVEKGSITVNGISLTVVDSERDQFSVAIIPYTYEHTNLKQVNAGDTVNLEFDIIGKYVARMMELRR